MSATAEQLAAALRKTLPFLETLYNQAKNAPTAFAKMDAERALADYDAQQANPPFSPIVAADLAPPRVAITVSDGFISVYSDKEVGVRVIDYDTDGSEPGNLRTIQFSEPDTSRQALVFDHADECGLDPEWIDQLFKLEPSE